VRRLPILPAMFIAILASPIGSSPISAQESSPETPGVVRPEPLPDVEGEASDDRIRALVESGDYETALERLRARIAGADAPEEQGPLRLVEARVLDRMGNGWESLRVYRRIFDDPEWGERARGEAHDLYVRRGEFAAADRLTSSVEEEGGAADPADVRRRAYARSVQGRFAEAVRLLEDPDLAGDGRASVLRANALLALGRREEAADLYLAVLGGEPDDAVRQVAHFGLGQVARLRGGRAVRAMQDEKAVLLGAASWAELDWGLALRALGRRQEARSRLTSAADEAPALAPTVKLALARLDEEEGRTDDALEHLAEALTGSVGDFLVWTRLGDLLLQEGREDEGIRAFRAALDLFPDFPPAAERLSRALVARGRWEEAGPEAVKDAPRWDLPAWTWDRLLDGDLPFYEMAADRDSVPAGDPRRTVLALVQLRAAFPAGALGWAEGATGRVAASIRAEALEAAGRDDDAEEAWQALLDGGTESAVALEHLATLAFPRDGDLAAARWDELFRRYPQDARARLRQARLLEEAERWEDALAAYREAETGGWFSSEELRRIRVARQDLESLLQEEEEARAD
jgi:tetratricopeptide (TPR) repeat protein